MAELLTTSARAPTYSSAHRPSLTVRQGESFCMVSANRFAALEAGEALDPDLVGAAVGPVHVEGIAPGDTVCIEVVEILPAAAHAYLLTSATYGILGDRLDRALRKVPVDTETVELLPGRRVPYRPMIGKLGLAPAAEALETSAFGDFGGAISNIHVRPDAKVYLRANHSGGLVFLEDVHAGMGDGEATASAIEMAARVTLRCSVDNSTGFTPPTIVTPQEVLTLGWGDDLDQAARAASEAMLDLLQARLGIGLTEAAMIVGSIVDVRIAFMGASPKKAYAAVSRAFIDL